MTNDPLAVAETLETSPSDAPAPVIRKARVCPECSEEFFPPSKGPGGHKRFCSNDCRNDWGYRAKVEGAAIVTIAKIWAANRQGNDVGNKAFARLREALDLMNQEDAKAGRHRLKAGGPLDPYIRAVLDEPYIDRRRRG